MPAKTTKTPIPKELNFKCIEEINKIVVEASVKLGDIIIKNILGTGFHIVACRNMDRAQ
nr:DUF1667 domain-containing protein [uncultured Clostridium sp.]